MRSVKLVAVVALLAGSVAFGASQIVYTLELGGNNHADLWEANQSPSFTKGAISGVPVVNAPDSLTWAVRVSVGGAHVGNPGDGLVPYGAANLVFDLELYDSTGTLVANFGAAPMIAQGNQNVPDGMGFWSSINDGDTAGTRGAIAPDVLANAAFAIGIRNNDPTGDDLSGQMYALHDAAPSGPNFDYGWYPTANGRGGVDIAGTKPINTAVAGLDGKLVGFGAGYKSYDYTTYRPGVGVAYLTAGTDYGFGKTVDRVYASDPLAAGVAEAERVVFEGQICTKNMAAGTYTLKVKPSADGNNILHGSVAWNGMTPDYGGFGSFAAKANEVYPNDTVGNPGMQFEVKVTPVTAIVAAHMYYNNSYYDGNKATIDPAPIATTNHDDDGDAIDVNKVPLVSGTATFANWSGYIKGINGLVYDISLPTRAPVAADFTCVNIGKAGTTSPGTTVNPTIGIWPGLGVGGSDRVFITFPDNLVQDTWLKVTVGTGFGLVSPVVHYWGNALGDCGSVDPLVPTNIVVNSTDELDIRNHPKTSGFSRAPVDWVWDLDKDSFANATIDQYYVRTHTKTGFTCVKVITK